MLDLIESVAALIDVRDRDDLEVTLAGVMFELVGATRLIVWRVRRRVEENFLHERIRLSANGLSSAPSRQPIGLADGPISEMRQELRAAFTAGCYACGPREANGRRRHVFPVLDTANVIGLIEIESSARLDDQRERLIHGLLRIYRSHLGVLESTDTDELTGLYNRRPFDETFRRVAGAKASALESRGARTVERSRPWQVQAELAVVDIDFFKRVNDRFGHPYGDEVLVLLARLMRRAFADNDQLYRFGGEEFVLLLPGLDTSGAYEALERFRISVENAVIPQVGHITVSIGVTTVNEGDTGSDAFGRADEALYFAKRSGRNQVQRYETLMAAGSLARKERSSAEIELF